MIIECKQIVIYVLLKLNNDTAIHTVPNMSNRKSRLVSLRHTPSSDAFRSVKIRFNADEVKFCRLPRSFCDQMNVASVVALLDGRFDATLLLNILWLYMLAVGPFWVKLTIVVVTNGLSSTISVQLELWFEGCGKSLLWDVSFVCIRPGSAVFGMFEWANILAWRRNSSNKSWRPFVRLIWSKHNCE